MAALRGSCVEATDLHQMPQDPADLLWFVDHSEDPHRLAQVERLS
jgi:hypothetical protein